MWRRRIKTANDGLGADLERHDKDDARVGNRSEDVEAVVLVVVQAGDVAVEEDGHKRKHACVDHGQPDPRRKLCKQAPRTGPRQPHEHSLTAQHANARTGEVVELGLAARLVQLGSAQQDRLGGVLLKDANKDDRQQREEDIVRRQRPLLVQRRARVPGKPWPRGRVYIEQD